MLHTFINTSPILLLWCQVFSMQGSVLSIFKLSDGSKLVTCTDMAFFFTNIHGIHIHVVCKTIMSV